MDIDLTLKPGISASGEYSASEPDLEFPADPSKVWYTKCEWCPAGKYVGSDGAASISECTTCESGKYSPLYIEGEDENSQPEPPSTCYSCAAGCV